MKLTRVLYVYSWIHFENSVRKSRNSPSFRNSTPRKLVSLSFRHGKYFLKDASFLETNKIIGLNMLNADFPLPVSSFIATEKSLFGGLIIPQDPVSLIYIRKRKFIKALSYFLTRVQIRGHYHPIERPKWHMDHSGEGGERLLRELF